MEILKPDKPTGNYPLDVLVNGFFNREMTLERLEKALEELKPLYLKQKVSVKTMLLLQEMTYVIVNKNSQIGRDSKPSVLKIIR